MKENNKRGYLGVYDIDPNVFVEQYKRDREVMWTIYEVMGIRPFYVEFDDNGHITSCVWSDTYRNSLGFENEEDFPDKIDSLLDLVHKDDIDSLYDAWWKMIRENEDNGGGSFDLSYRCHTKSGDIRWFHSAGKVTRHVPGSSNVFIGLSHDITDEKRHNSALEEQYEIVDALAKDYLNVFMVDLDRETASIVKLDGYVTEGFGDKTLGEYPYTPFSLKYINDRVYPEDKPGITEAMNIDRVRKELSDKSEYVYSYRAVEGDEVHFYQFTYIKLKSKKGKDRIIAGFKNIDATVASAREKEALKVLSETDIMTGVLNRGHGEKVTSQAIAEGNPGMMCILDMDGFKDINDTYGHDVGDKVLIKAAECLKKAFRKSDIIFRLGGDEFAAAAVGCRRIEDAKNLINRFFSLIDTILIPELGTKGVSVSVGAVMFDGETQDFEHLYRQADQCVYQSKKIKGNAVTFYNSEEEEEKEGKEAKEHAVTEDDALVRKENTRGKTKKALQKNDKT